MIDNETSSLLSLENNASSLSDQSDLTTQTLHEDVEPSEKVETFSDHLTQLPTVPDKTKVTKFKCVSKVLTFEIETERKSKPRIKQKVSKNIKAQSNLSALNNEQSSVYNLESFPITGNNCNLDDKECDKINSRRRQSRSKSFAGFAKTRSRLSSYMLGESLPGKLSLSNRLSSFTNKNKYSVAFSEFTDKSIFNDRSKMYPKTEKSPKENLFPPNWKFKNEDVATATMKTKRDLQTLDVKEILSGEVY